MQMIWPLELPHNLLHCTLKTTDIYFRSTANSTAAFDTLLVLYKIFKYVGHSMLERLFREKKNVQPTSHSQIMKILY